MIFPLLPTQKTFDDSDRLLDYFDPHIEEAVTCLIAAQSCSTKKQYTTWIETYKYIDNFLTATIRNIKRELAELHASSEIVRVVESDNDDPYRIVVLDLYHYVDITPYGTAEKATTAFLQGRRAVLSALANRLQHALVDAKNLRTIARIAEDHDGDVPAVALTVNSKKRLVVKGSVNDT